MSKTKVAERPITMQSTKVIDAGIGTIRWSSNNIQLMHLMEAVEEKLKTTSPNDIVTILTA